MISWLARALATLRKPAPPTTDAQVIAIEGQVTAERARSQVGRGVYKLGTGGRDPHAATPFITGQCDCSGFVAWCLGLDRYQPGKIDGDWVSTTAVWRDAQGPRRLFERVEPAQATAGDIVVYGSTYEHGRRVGIGHIGVVVEPAVIVATMRIVHCAASGEIAVRESNGAVWDRHHGIVARLR